MLERDIDSLDRFADGATSGFAIILVLWVVGLISLLAFTVVWAARIKVQTARNIVETAQAEELADAGVYLVKLAILQPASREANTQQNSNLSQNRQGPIMCSMPDGALAVISVENEAGKVDLNTASPEILAQLLRGIGADGREAQEIAGAIVEFARIDIDHDRQQRQAALEEVGVPPPKHAPFDTILELDQVKGMRRDLFQTLLPYVTVSSHRPKIDPDLASPALSSALAGAPVSSVVRLAKQTASARPVLGSVFAQAGIDRSMIGGSFLIHVETVTASGGIFVREVNIDVVGGPLPIRTTEWRRGRGRYGGILSTAQREMGRVEGRNSPYPDCGGRPR